MFPSTSTSASIPTSTHTPNQSDTFEDTAQKKQRRNTISESSNIMITNNSSNTNTNNNDSITNNNSDTDNGDDIIDSDNITIFDNSYENNNNDDNNNNENQDIDEDQDDRFKINDTNNNISNEVILRQLTRIEKHFHSIEERFKLQDHRITAIQATNEEILIKMNNFNNNNFNNSSSNNHGFHSSASVSPSLGVQSAMSTSASTPVSQLGGALIAGEGDNLQADHQNRNHHQHPHHHQQHGQHSHRHSQQLNPAAAQLAAVAAAAVNQQDSETSLALATQILTAFGLTNVGAGAGVCGQTASASDLLARSGLLGASDQLAANVTNQLAKHANSLAQQTGVKQSNSNNSQHLFNSQQQHPHHNNSTNNNNNSIHQHHSSRAAAAQQLNTHAVAQRLAAAQAVAQQLASSTSGSLHHQTGGPLSANGANAGANNLIQAAAAGLAQSVSTGVIVGTTTTTSTSSSAGPPNNLPQVVQIPHPHSHQALSQPSNSLLAYEPPTTIKTKYSTRRYSRRRVGPEEAMADPNIRATVDLVIPVVQKTILIVLKHRLTVQTAITLACAQTGERLRKGAIQKKLEAMFREPHAVDAFMAEWDRPR